MRIAKDLKLSRVLDESLQLATGHRSQATNTNYNCTLPRTPPALRWHRPLTYTSNVPSALIQKLGLISQIRHVVSYGSVRWVDHQKGDWQRWVKLLMPVVILSCEDSTTLRYNHWSPRFIIYQSLVSTCPSFDDARVTCVRKKKGC